MKTTTKTQDSSKNALISDAMDVLLQHLGPEKTARFWQVLAPQRGDYTKLRRKLFAGKSADDLDREIKKFNKHR